MTGYLKWGCSVLCMFLVDQFERIWCQIILILLKVFTFSHISWLLDLHLESSVTCFCFLGLICKQEKIKHVFLCYKILNFSKKRLHTVGCVFTQGKACMFKTHEPLLFDVSPILFKIILYICVWTCFMKIAKKRSVHAL